MWGKTEAGVGQQAPAAEKRSDKPADKHLIAESAISIQKVIGHGEFGVVQQAIWTKDHGQRVSVMSCFSQTHCST